MPTPRAKLRKTLAKEHPPSLSELQHAKSLHQARTQFEIQALIVWVRLSSKFKRCGLRHVRAARLVAQRPKVSRAVLLSCLGTRKNEDKKLAHTRTARSEDRACRRRLPPEHIGGKLRRRTARVGGTNGELHHLQGLSWVINAACRVRRLPNSTVERPAACPRSRPMQVGLRSILSS